MVQRFLFISFLVLSINAFAQEKFALKKDLRNEWMHYEKDAYTLVGQQALRSVNTIYIHLDANQFVQERLRIQSGRPFFLFVNGKLLTQCQQGYLMFKLDSIAAIAHTASLLISVHQPSPINERDL